MNAPRVMLIQVRDPDNEMTAHEEACIRLRLAHRPIELEVRNVFASRPEAAWAREADALLIGGSGSFSVHHPDSARWVDPLRELLEAILAGGQPGFGICFGHQLLGYHLGIPVQTDETTAEVGTVALELTDAGRNDPLFSFLGNEFQAHTGHSDHVAQTPKGVTLLAASAQLPTQAFRVEGTPFYTTQFHPDLTGAEARDRFLAYRCGLPEQSPFDSDAAARFRFGEDACTGILSRFVDLLFD